MNDEQRRALASYFADWMNMASVGLLLVGMFQPDHMFGGLIGATVCAISGMILKIWSKK